MSLLASRESRRTKLIHAGGTLIAVLLLVYLFSRQGWDEIIQAFGQITPWRLGLAVALTFLSRFAVALRWHVLLRAVEVDISIWRSIQITFTGLFVSHFLPTTVGGDVVRLGSILRLGYGRAVSAASLVIDRLIGMLGMAMATLGLLTQTGLFVELITQTIRHPFWEETSDRFVMSPWILVISVQGTSGRIRPLWTKFTGAINRFWGTLIQWRGHPGALMASLAFTWIHMLCLFASIWLFMAPLGETLQFWFIAGLWSLTYYITLLPISLNGLGIQELSLTFFFTRFGGIQATSAITIALLVRVIQMLASLPGAFFIPNVMAGNGNKMPD